MDDLISRQSALDALDKHFESFIKRFGYESYERADEKTKLVCDGLSEAEDVIMGLPSATDTNVGTKLVIDPYKIERAIRGLTEWQKHVQTESDIDRDISVAVEALKAQLGTNLAEVGTDLINRQVTIDAITDELDKIDHVPQWVFDRLEKSIRQLPSAQPINENLKFLEFLWNRINPNEMEQYLAMYQSKEVKTDE